MNYEATSARARRAVLLLSWHSRPGVASTDLVPPISARTASSCNCELQLHTFPRSVDSRRLKWDLTSFRINTSKNLCTFCISLIGGQLKSPIINTSTNFDFKFSRINTSTKHGGGGSSCNKLQLAMGAFLPADTRRPSRGVRDSRHPHAGNRRLQARPGESAVAEILLPHLLAPRFAASPRCAVHSHSGVCPPAVSERRHPTLSLNLTEAISLT
jgi:hypothetical protein